MTAAPAATALIAEDEPLLASALQAELARAWPNLQVLAIAGDGLAAVQMALQHRPDVLFFDIRMPGQSGLDAAAELADRWDDSNQSGKPFPALVFVTAYDQYAVQAFEAQAMDYLQKPLQQDRLQRAVDRLQAVLATRAATAPVQGGDAGAGADTMDRTLAQLRALLAAGSNAGPTARLSVIQASVGNSIRMVPLEEVAYFEAADKYIRVVTAEHEYLIRTPLRELLPQLDPQQFWQVHRATVVRAQAVVQVTRDEAGKLWLHLRARREKLPVSRLYAHLFKAM